MFKNPLKADPLIEKFSSMKKCNDFDIYETFPSWLWRHITITYIFQLQ